MINTMKQGFTLIELLVVITIISILTVITASQFQTAKQKANDVARKGDLNATAKALQMYFNDYGSFPDVSATNSPPSAWGGTFEDNSVPPYIYMKKLPIENHLSSYPYCYKISADKKKYGLFAQLESTRDKVCNETGYQCGGVTYCFGVVSPNTSLEEMSGL